MSSVAGEPAHTRRFWAKARPYGQPRPEKVHLLEHHLADVGACFEALLAQPTIRRRLARCGGLATLDDETAARLALFAAMHDVGKANVGFQTRVWAADDHPRGRRPGYAGHYRELAPVLTDQDGETAGWFFDELDWWWEAVDTWDDHSGETVCGLLVAALSHHGRPLALEGDLTANPRLWRDYGELRPREQVARIGAAVRRWFPAAFDANALALPARPEFQHMFLGLCTLADWIGSNEKWFPFVDEPEDDYFFSVARPTAARALREVGLDVAAQRDAFSGARGFDALFGFAPNAIQRAAVDAPLDAPVVILESETGSGKTEAALWRFARMYEKRLVDGIYFALPTRAAASQIHSRVRRFVERLFPQGAPPVVLAVPGYDPGEDAARASLQEYDERAAGEHRPESPWAAESPKRYLAAQVAVGTVDQAMMAALKVGHSHMRAACLARNLLVVDEVHASDTYMGRVIKALLDAHTDAGGHALLMSATLGSAARWCWLAAGRPPRGDASPFDEACGAPYPAVGVRQARAAELRPVDGGGRSKNVSMSERRVMANFQAVAELALDAARRGAKVLVVRNTVGHAVATQRALEERAGAGDTALLFGVNGVRAPHHGRFAAADRALLDGAVETRLGKERRPGGAVVVGTQTLEQSLDIDADLLITDLCPADVLLQRIGRLHRHARDDRPAGYATPACVVLTLRQSIRQAQGQDSGQALRGRPRIQYGAGSVAAAGPRRERQRPGAARRRLRRPARAGSHAPPGARARRVAHPRDEPRAGGARHAPGAAGGHRAGAGRRMGGTRQRHYGRQHCRGHHRRLRRRPPRQVVLHAQPRRALSPGRGAHPHPAGRRPHRRSLRPAAARTVRPREPNRQAGGVRALAAGRRRAGVRDAHAGRRRLHLRRRRAAVRLRPAGAAAAGGVSGSGHRADVPRVTSVRANLIDHVDGLLYTNPTPSKIHSTEEDAQRDVSHEANRGQHTR